MEQQLSKWFRLAEKWGAVMLIDEADVYLERRVVSDLKRNSLVSGMLHLQFYFTMHHALMATSMIKLTEFSKSLPPLHRILQGHLVLDHQSCRAF